MAPTSDPPGWLRRIYPLNQRIRNRRERLRLTASELAQRADISPSYVSLIEKGSKVPDQDVAVRLARALEDNPDVYRTLAQVLRFGSASDFMKRLEFICTNPQLRAWLADGRDFAEIERREQELEKAEETADGEGELIPDERKAAMARRLEAARERVTDEADAEIAGLEAIADRLAETREKGHTFEHRVRQLDEVRTAVEERHSRLFHQLPAGFPASSRAAPTRDAREFVAAAQEPPSRYESRIMFLPVFPSGHDPDEPLPTDAEQIGVDTRILPEAPAASLLAYELTDRDIVRVGGGLVAGDYLVMTRDVGELTPERIYAVRNGSQVMLSRILAKETTLVLLPPSGSADFQVLSREDSLGRRTVAAQSVLTIHRWT